MREYRLEEYGEMRPDLDRACAGYIVNALRRLGWDLVTGNRKHEDSLAKELGIVDSQRRLFGRLLEVLADDQLLARRADSWEVISAPASLDVGTLMEHLHERHPRLRAQIDLTKRCGSQLGEVLRGEVNPLDLLFAGGSLSAVEPLYKDAPSALVFNRLVSEAVSLLCNTTLPKNKLRVLEIGAGTGATSSFVLPVLSKDCTEYVFTDLSPIFLGSAREKFSDYPFVRYEILDIERNPQTQGFPTAGFDLVIASNVLHATSDIRKSLANVRSLLAPGGILIAVELTSAERWANLTFGLTEGWWRFTDRDLRKESPVLCASDWKRVLEETGFRAAMVPEHSDDGIPPATVIVAQSAQDASAHTHETVLETSRARWIVFSGANETGAAVVQSLRRRGIHAVTVEPGERYTCAKDRLTVDPGCPEDFERAIQQSSEGSPSEILFLWGLDAVRDSNSDIADQAADLCASAAYVARGALKQTGSRLWMVTCGAQATGQYPHPVARQQATLWGLGRTIALEQPEIWGGLLDLDPQEQPEQQAEWVIGNAIAEDGEDQVAIRNGQRLSARLEKVSSLPSSTFALSAQGSYLITGGLGGLGLKIARWLVDHGARHLVLVGRRGLPERASDTGRAVDALEELGVKVNIVAADVACRSQMESLFSRFGGEWPPLRGIVHAALSVNQRAVCDVDKASILEVFSAKIKGTDYLLELGSSQPLDFVYLFSSMAALLGVTGGCHYAAACHYLDAIAHDRRLAGVPVSSIAWGAWDELRNASEEMRRVFRAGGHSSHAGGAGTRRDGRGAGLGYSSDRCWFSGLGGSPGTS